MSDNKNKKIGRPRKGAIRRLPSGRLQAVVTLVDGTQRRLPRGGFPKGTSEARAREHALYLQEKADKLEPAEADSPTIERKERRATDRWVESWFADREARGLTSVPENRGHWDKHISEHLGDKHPRDWTTDELRALSLALDRKVQQGELSAKTAINIWGTATRMCDDAHRHKSNLIRCREDNPARDVRGPDRGANKAREFLYPSEFLRFMRCSLISQEWKETVAVAVYTFMRLGELQVLRWTDVNLDNRTIHIHRARDRRSGGVKSTKGRQARRIPIHPNLAPLLDAMKARATSELVLRLPSDRDMARGFRRNLELAQVSRVELFTVEETSRRIVFHDLRGTGITWHAIAGTEPLRIQQWAGHTDFATTQEYLATADAVGRNDFGEPFPEFPVSSSEPEFLSELSGAAFFTASNLRSGRDSNLENTEEFTAFTGDFEATEELTVGVESPKSAKLGELPETTDSRCQERSDPVEVALATAIGRASQAGEWSVVAQLARELEARRTAHAAPNVVELRPKKDTR